MIIAFILLMLFYLGIIAFFLLCLWKIVAKAGEPGWSGIIPIYNMVVLAKIGEKPLWWGALVLIPIAGIVFQIWIWNRVVKRFGYSEGFTVGIVLLPIVFIPILAFSNAKYRTIDESFNSEMTN